MKTLILAFATALLTFAQQPQTQPPKPPQVTSLTEAQKRAVLKKAFKLKSIEADIASTREQYMREMNDKIQQLRNAYQQAAAEYQQELAPLADALKDNDLDEDLNLIPKKAKAKP